MKARDLVNIVVEEQWDAEPQGQVFPTPFAKRVSERLLLELQRRSDFRKLRSIVAALRAETRPIEEHTDPGAIQDCWNELSEAIDALEALLSSSEGKSQ